MATSVKTKDRHLKTRKNAADARSIYTRKRRVREAAELEKSSFLDRTGKNIQKMYSHPIWGKVAGVATVLLLTFLAKKTGEAVKRHTNINLERAAAISDAAKVAQGVISSPTGLANLFSHLYKSMVEGAKDASSIGATPSATDNRKILTELTAAMGDVAQSRDKVLKVVYREDRVDFIVEPRGEDKLIEDVYDPHDTHVEKNRSAPGSPEHEGQPTLEPKSLDSFYKILSTLNPERIAKFAADNDIYVDVSTGSTDSPAQDNLHPDALKIITRLAKLKPDQIDLLIRKLNLPDLTPEQKFMIILEVLWTPGLFYNGSDDMLRQAISIACSETLGAPDYHSESSVGIGESDEESDDDDFRAAWDSVERNPT